MALSTTSLLLLIPISSYGIYLNVTSQPLGPWRSWSDTHFDFGRIEQIPAIVWRASPRAVVANELNRWIAPACSFIFFAYFGVASEARRHYSKAFWFVASKLGFEPRHRNEKAGLQSLGYVGSFSHRDPISDKPLPEATSLLRLKRSPHRTLFLRTSTQNLLTRAQRHPSRPPSPLSRKRSRSATTKAWRARHRLHPPPGRQRPSTTTSRAGTRTAQSKPFLLFPLSPLHHPSRRSRRASPQLRFRPRTLCSVTTRNSRLCHCRSRTSKLRMVHVSHRLSHWRSSSRRSRLRHSTYIMSHHEFTTGEEVPMYR